MGRIPGIIHEEIVDSVKEMKIVCMVMDTRRNMLGRNNSEDDGEMEVLVEKSARLNRTRNMTGDSAFGTLKGKKGV